MGLWATPPQPRILRLLVLAGPLCGKACMGSCGSQGGFVSSILANRELGTNMASASQLQCLLSLCHDEGVEQPES